MVLRVEVQSSVPSRESNRGGRTGMGRVRTGEELASSTRQICRVCLKVSFWFDWINVAFCPCLLSARQPHFHILVRIWLVTVFSWDKRYEISSAVVVLIQLKSLRLPKHDEENDMTIGARQGMGWGCGGKRTGKRWHMRRSYSLIWKGNNKERALKENLKKYFIQQDDDFWYLKKAPCLLHLCSLVLFNAFSQLKYS